jgi:hypothetical protein
VASHETLGLLLVRDGVITRPQLYDALRLQRQNNRLLGTCLLILGYAQPEILLDFLSRQLSIPALPPGTLGRAAPEAFRRLPRDVALRLRVVPYSWDGEILGVAMADGRALNHLHEVAFHSQSAVGAYVALEMEIEAVLRTIYPDLQSAFVDACAAPTQLLGRQRPARAEPAREVPTRDFGRALGFEDGAGEPVMLAAPKSTPPNRRVIPAAPPRAPLRGPPPPARAPLSGPRTDKVTVASSTLTLERVGFYDAVEQIYRATTVDDVGRCVGRALLSYFSRVVISLQDDRQLRIIGFGGVPAPPAHVALTGLPSTAAALEHRSIAYGLADTDGRSAELTSAFNLTPAPTSLIAPVAGVSTVRFLIYADNAEVAELYEDLHDVELLFKEAETALRILQGAP